MEHPSSSADHSPTQTKQPVDDPRFQLDRPRNRRLKKAPIILLLAGVGVLLIGTVYFALKPAGSQENTTRHTFIDPDSIKRAIPDALKLSDSDFASKKTEPDPEPPQLGPPLQGDLGGFQLKQPLTPAPLPVAQPLPKPVTAYQPPPPPKQPSPEELAQLRREQLAREMAEKALTAGLFFDVPIDRPGVAVSQSAPGNAAYGLRTAHQPGYAEQSYRQLQQLTYRADPTQPAKQMGTLTQSQAQKLAHSPYQLKAGAIIPAVLLTGINADLPGQIIAQVREEVFDTVTGQYLLIPQGTRVLGQYDNNVAYGQERAGVIWNRLIFPDGRSADLGKMPGVDGMGQSGYQDQVDHHWGRLATGVVLSSLLAGTAGYNSDRDGFSGRFYENVGMEINRTGQRLTRKNLNIQPTIQIRPGYSINILVNRDLTLLPIPPDQTNPWEATVFPASHSTLTPMK